MKPLIEAHRGDSSNAPENTLAAFKRALGSGVPSIELDVRPARDGTPMVIHDATVDRTTDGSGYVWDMTVDELLRLDAGAKFGRAFAGERIPRLSDVLEIVAPTPVLLNVEIKTFPAGAPVPVSVAGLLRRFGKERKYIVSSFDLPSLLQVRAMAPEIALALIGNGPEALAAARRHGLPWIHCSHRTVDKGLVAEAHGHGVRVSVWTVDYPDLLPFWHALGVDKICTNRPALMLAAVGGLSRSSAP
ncbi:MAG: glycerophosphodiester phosphodiesterase family protein [Desulfobulbaceae bacterium]|jgi:glycerophosphoryl diester phosphodiesterase|nr:glycerophosphodiester phosphodiesterase family protein [Desulfobulbaceae bacterium]MDY0349637.1 glycerophosphodiester phosphodiesterase family protein [Desulfobulbaceae bacterium]